MLGPLSAIVQLSAFTELARGYQPPVDTVDAIIEIETRITNSFSISIGSSTSGSECTITGDCCSRYSWYRRRGFGWKYVPWAVYQIIGAQQIKNEFPNEGTRVQREVAAWAQSLASEKN